MSVDSVGVDSHGVGAVDLDALVRAVPGVTGLFAASSYAIPGASLVTRKGHGTIVASIGVSVTIPAERTADAVAAVIREAVPDAAVHVRINRIGG